MNRGRGEHLPVKHSTYCSTRTVYGRVLYQMINRALNTHTVDLLGLTDRCGSHRSSTISNKSMLKSTLPPLFLTFDSHVNVSDLSPSSSAAPWRAQELFVWGASTNKQKMEAWRAIAPQAKLSYYMPYSRAPSSSKGFGLDFWLREHPDWILYRCDRKTVAFWNAESAPTGSVPLDFTNPDVIRWQVENQSVFAQQHGYDAMAFDNYGGGARQGASPGQRAAYGYAMAPNGRIASTRAARRLAICSQRQCGTRLSYGWSIPAS